MIKECDFVVVAAPLTAETRGMIGAAELAAMKPTAFLINMARGGVVDQTRAARRAAGTEDCRRCAGCV